MALYIRVSSEEQAKGHSPAGQYRELRAYCDRMGYRIVRAHFDNESGQTFDRHQFQLLMAYAQARSFEAIVVWRRDRFGRDPIHMGLIERDLRSFDVRLESISGPQEDNDETELFNLILDGISRYEARKTAARCMMGKKEAARTGRCPFGRLPFGYYRDRLTKAVCIQPDDAAVVQEVFRLVAAGQSSHAVSARVGRTSAVVRSWLRNPAYRGVLRFDGIEVADALPRIVADDTATQAHQALATRRPAQKDRPAGQHGGPGP